MEYNIPKGVFDILPFSLDDQSEWKVADRWQYLESVIRKACLDYGFQEIRTPVFEKTELFLRSSGETSDIVSKEMYTFEDKGGRSMTLRPEGTACVMRSVLENRLYQGTPNLKLFYLSSMFRYDRPQAGRYRQHHQFGAESIGCEKPEQDVEIILLLSDVYKRLGLKNLTIQINSVGDIPSRARFSQALKEFLLSHFDRLSQDSQTRFHKNPLRILDSKSPEDQLILQEAPSILDSLNEESKDHFQKVLHLLKESDIEYVINPKLVRGLDYYNKTVFEITAGDLGAQNSIGGGGRYDGLAASFGGPDLPSIGFGTGLERILQTMIKQECTFPPSPHCHIYILPLGEKAQEYCFPLTLKLRRLGIPTEMDFSSKKLQQGLQIASKLQANYCLIIGDQELASKLALLKDMNSRTQESIPLAQCVEVIQKSHS